jgi:predicted metalloprotease with PDZ domain
MYWGGAVIALKAEVALQQQTRGRLTLSDALQGLQDCCLAAGQAWTAADLFNELDRISGTRIFTTLYEKEVKRLKYPEYATLLAQLGVLQTSWGSVRLTDQAPLAHIRKRLVKK